ncbi:DUF6464 family protein [Synechococcus sp. H70.1]|uniref:DUF6464 family protein n=1 Tax=Synechococcus sp. H70.1 TaxID=2964527 RepID=UPI0039C7381B
MASVNPTLPIQWIDADSGEVVEECPWESSPHPGTYVQLAEQHYLVLEKRHSYQLRQGKYHLCSIRALIRPVSSPLEIGQLLGDPSCRFNAHSPLLRCAVNPSGPCQGCPHYEPVQRR